MSKVTPAPDPVLPMVADLKLDGTSDTVTAALEFVRTHLDMEVAYLSEFVADDLVFRAVSAPGFEDLAHVGRAVPLDQVYCRHILAGRLPELIVDTASHQICQALDLTHAIPIRSHVSVPIRRRDGSAYGMFCCLSRSARPDLTQRDLAVMRAFADLSAEQVNDKISARVAFDAARSVIGDVLDRRDFDIAYQPIMDAAARRPKGFEALCRFRPQPYRPPNLWFDDAKAVGLQTDLEICVIEKALAALDDLPPHIYVSVNASPETVASGRLGGVFKDWPTERIVLEVTEHAMVEDYDGLLRELDALRFRGIRLAIDDAGAGYSGLQHIVRLHPDIIKLDISLTSQIDTDIVRRSLAAALVRFAVEIDAAIVAEGIETENELITLHELGVPLAQGYYLGKFADLDRARAWFQHARPAQGAAG
ncbi:diguanylate phosphodiesterase [Pelagivirga sediminicola]|uniref:Diguanylate phosphodiesterase n=1 Tax=Pelagivirga sediminicola TaxID=2170575 RepID=A0A2T7GBL7_9RHOB|nr:EAL domain-containing protein [Pelagivirga sediminicola]PVA11820.1 diguanylate phosphodiesterase [Pelagivirga sediminicola]